MKVIGVLCLVGGVALLASLALRSRTQANAPLPRAPAPGYDTV
jgi:hypothetical protein